MTGEQLLRELLEAEPLAGKRALDYGCGDAACGLWLAAQSAEVTLVDSTQSTIEMALGEAAARGLTRRIKGIAAHSVALDMFADFAFDIVVLHGACDYSTAELARILRPGARLISQFDLGAAEGFEPAGRRWAEPARWPWSTPGGASFFVYKR